MILIKHGRTLLHEACTYGDVNTVKILLR
ncbi:MAG: hypothetical protein KTR29_17230 [Rhodothermaceae bacterium]|nr:hypothetical protein [Rhodothermaceae bacterium]